MKIAYVLNTYPQPSHSFIRRELQALEESDIAVARLAMRRATEPLVDSQDRDEAARTEYVLDAGAVGLSWVLLLALLRAPRRFWSALRLVRRLSRSSPLGLTRHLIYLAEAAYVARRARREGLQHLHAHFGTNAATVAMLAHALGGPGYSFTVHGPEEFDAPGALSLGLKLDRAAFAVGVSQFGRSQLSRWAAFGTWPRLKVVHCGIDPTRFGDLAPLPDGRLRLVSIGRFVEQKGQMVLIEALAQLADSHPDIHLTLVGDGEMRADLEAAIRQQGLEQMVTLTGWLSEDEVQAQIAGAHALVLPSFAEGLPMVIMEAMAAGRPVISTFVAGIPELVVPGETGLLVPAGDVDALARAIGSLSELSTDALQAMGNKGRIRVLARHDMRAEASKLTQHFRAVVDRQGGT